MNESKLLTLGRRIWPTTYGEGMTDAETFAAITADALNADDPACSAPEIRSSCLWAAKWVHGGCRIIQSDASYFSAMACTDMPPEYGSDLKVTWPCFLVRLPSGLFVDERGVEYTFALLGQFDEMSVEGGTSVLSYLNIWSSGADVTLWDIRRGGLHRVLFGEFVPMPDAFEGTGIRMSESSSDKRIRELVRKGIAGLLYTMQHTRHWSFGSAMSRAGSKSKGRLPPTHRAIIVGKPLTLNLTSAVSTDARTGGHSTTSVQTLVRGHVKRQACGPRLSARKLIWIEPYWRGPEDAPILARPYRVAS